MLPENWKSVLPTFPVQVRNQNIINTYIHIHIPLYLFIHTYIHTEIGIESGGYSESIGGSSERHRGRVQRVDGGLCGPNRIEPHQPQGEV